MAHHSATKKSIRQTAKRTERNRELRTRYRNAVKKVRSAVEAKDAKKAAELLTQAQKILFKSVSKGVLTKETASRTVSRLNAQVKKIAA